MSACNITIYFEYTDPYRGRYLYHIGDAQRRFAGGRPAKPGRLASLRSTGCQSRAGRRYQAFVSTASALPGVTQNKHRQEDVEGSLLPIWSYDSCVCQRNAICTVISGNELRAYSDRFYRRFFSYLSWTALSIRLCCRNDYRYKRRLLERGLVIRDMPMAGKAQPADPHSSAMSLTRITYDE